MIESHVYGIDRIPSVRVKGGILSFRVKEASL